MVPKFFGLLSPPAFCPTGNGVILPTVGTPSPTLRTPKCVRICCVVISSLESYFCTHVVSLASLWPLLAGRSLLPTPNPQSTSDPRWWFLSDFSGGVEKTETNSMIKGKSPCDANPDAISLAALKPVVSLPALSLSPRLLSQSSIPCFLIWLFFSASSRSPIFAVSPVSYFTI